MPLIELGFIFTIFSEFIAIIKPHAIQSKSINRL